jgi:hypothetical protein
MSSPHSHLAHLWCRLSLVASVFDGALFQPSAVACVLLIVLRLLLQCLMQFDDRRGIQLFTSIIAETRHILMNLAVAGL